jgi:hypothetical protein
MRKENLLRISTYMAAAADYLPLLELRHFMRFAETRPNS